MTPKLKTEIADLKRQLAEVKAALAPSPAPSSADVAKWRDEMHQAAERRMSRASNFSAEDLRAMEAACPTAACRDIARHGTIPTASISAVPTSQQLIGVHRDPGIAQGSTGWRNATPIAPPPGVAILDGIMDAEDRKDRHELIKREAARLALEKAMKP